MRIAAIVLSIISIHTFAQGVVVKNGTIHVGNGQVIEGAILVTEKDKIQFVGLEKDAKIDISGKQTIDAQQGHVYPGLISMYTSIGLTEIDYVRASNDFFEIGSLNAHIRAGIAYNVDSDILPTVLSNGILVAQATPRGGLVAGTSAAMYLNGWTFEEAQIKTDEGLHINWPLFYAEALATDAAKADFATNRTKEILKLKTFFTEAKAYHLGTKTPKNLRFEGVKGVFDSTQSVYIVANKAKEILEVIAFVKEMAFGKPIIVGANEALAVAAELHDQHIPVVLYRVHNTPPTPESDVDYAYTLPAKLMKAGVKFALSYYGDMEAAHSRNLPFIAGTAAAYGLSKEEALAAITSIPATLLGIADKLGTLQAGKQASFIISKGDILDMKTSKVTIAYIKGEKMDINDKQKALNQKYLAKYKLN